MPVYLAERYIPGADPKLAAAQSDRLRAALQRAGQSTVQLLSTTWVPDEEWAFDLLEADSASEVECLYASGQVAFERVTEAIHLKGLQQ